VLQRRLERALLAPKALVREVLGVLLTLPTDAYLPAVRRVAVRMIVRRFDVDAEDVFVLFNGYGLMDRIGMMKVILTVVCHFRGESDTVG
jgi:hypothetical protein